MKVLSWLQGGLGNKINNAINTLWLQEMYGGDVFFVWYNVDSKYFTETKEKIAFNHCMSNFEDLYEIRHIDKELLENTELSREIDFNDGDKDVIVAEHYLVVNADNYDIRNLGAKADALREIHDINLHVSQEPNPEEWVEKGKLREGRNNEIGEVEWNSGWIHIPYGTFHKNENIKATRLYKFKGDERLRELFRKLRNKNYVLLCSEVFPFLTDEEIAKQLYKIKPKKEIIDTAYEFIKNNNIDKTVKGISLRISDMDNFGSYVLNGKPLIKISENLNARVVEYKEKGYILLLEEIDKMIRYNIKVNPFQKYYITADEKKYEEHFKELFPYNVIIREKETDLKKSVDDLDWIVDLNNDIFNIVRDNEYVQDSLIDAIIASKTNYLTYHQASTYTQYIKYLQLVDYEN